MSHMLSSADITNLLSEQKPELTVKFSKPKTIRTNFLSALKCVAYKNGVPCTHPRSRSTPPKDSPDTACTLYSRSSSHQTDDTGTAPAGENKTCISKAETTARDSLQKHWTVLAAVLIIMLVVVQVYLLHISNFFH